MNRTGLSSAPPGGSAPLPRRRRGPVRRAIFGLVAVAIVLLTSMGSVQVLSQAFWPEVLETPLTCREGAAALLRATERARLTVQEASTLGERSALAAFRGALQPEWGYDEVIYLKCEAISDQEAMVALRAVRFLRYAEERSVRAEALDLARLRTVAPRLVRGLDPSPAPSLSP